MWRAMIRVIRSPSQLSRGASERRHGLHHRLEPLPVPPPGTVCCSSPFRGCARPRLLGPTRGPRQRLCWRCCPQGLLDLHVEIGFIRDPSAGSRAAIDRPSAPISRPPRSRRSRVIASVLYEAVSRQEPGERRIDTSRPGSRDVEPIFQPIGSAPAARISRPPRQERRGAALSRLMASSRSWSLAAVIDGTPRPRPRLHVVCHEGRIEHARIEHQSTRSTWPITFAWPVFSVSALIHTIPMCTSMRSA